MPVPAVAPLVCARSVSKRWGRTTALSGVSLEIAAGITGVLGTNGAGKTTLVELMLGLSRPDEGSLEVLGVDPWRLGPQVRSRLGWAPEDHLFPGDVSAHDLVSHLAEVHGLPHRAAVGRTSDVLHLVGMREERFRPVQTLSTGQRQRVKLAQAIVHDPALIFLDEPTNGLDPVERQHVLTLLRHVRDALQIDIVLCSHLLGEVEQVCDSVVILSRGRVAASGRLAELRNRTREIAVEVDGPATVVASALAAMGIRATVDGARLLVPQHGDETYDAVRDAVAASGVGLRRLGVHVESLEDVFLDADGEGTP
jgi:ABC-2 type transport system ATP-binding protein